MDRPILRSRSTVTVCERLGEKGASQTCRSSRVRLTWSKSLSGVRGSYSYSGSTFIDKGSAVTCRPTSFSMTGKPWPSKISIPARPTKFWSPQVDTQLKTSVRPRGKVGMTTLCVGLKRLATREDPIIASWRSSATRPSRASCSSNSLTGMLMPSNASSWPGVRSWPRAMSAAASAGCPLAADPKFAVRTAPSCSSSTALLSPHSAPFRFSAVRFGPKNLRL
mmetsp:Transcript_31990/g.91781  ORF Transcript_31990/g.91781 Transcript_31990/m.91781 type:complete len:222 (-) Transcript_31990:2165-2830(-)